MSSFPPSSNKQAMSEVPGSVFDRILDCSNRFGLCLEVAESLSLGTGLPWAPVSSSNRRIQFYKGVSPSSGHEQRVIWVKRDLGETSLNAQANLDRAITLWICHCFVDLVLSHVTPRTADQNSPADRGR